MEKWNWQLKHIWLVNKKAIDKYWGFPLCFLSTEFYIAFWITKYIQEVIHVGFWVKKKSWPLPKLNQ